MLDNSLNKKCEPTQTIKNINNSKKVKFIKEYFLSNFSFKFAEPYLKVIFSRFIMNTQLLLSTFTSCTSLKIMKFIIIKKIGEQIMLCSINTSVALLQIRYVRIRINLPDPIQIIVIRSSAKS